MKIKEGRYLMNKTVSLHVLISEEDKEWVAHCLEFDIVATAKDFTSVKKDILDLIKAHIGYAIENNNMAYLFKPAPPEVWKAFWSKKTQVCDTTSFETKPHKKNLDTPRFDIQELCHA